MGIHALSQNAHLRRHRQINQLVMHFGPVASTAAPNSIPTSLFTWKHSQKPSVLVVTAVKPLPKVEKANCVVGFGMESNPVPIDCNLIWRWRPRPRYEVGVLVEEKL
jgi:hypothetical protein